MARKKEKWREKPTEEERRLGDKWTTAHKGRLWTRLKKEKRYQEANEFREAARLKYVEEGMIQRHAVNRAWEDTEAAFPPLEEKTPEPEVDDVEFDKLTVDSQPDLARDVLWAYDNLELKSTKPEDAPSVGAWSLLKWAREYRNRFFEQLVPKAMAAKAKESDTGPIENTDPDLESVKKLLKSFGGK